MRTTWVLIGGMCMLGAGAGCSAQADPDYRGEPVELVRGIVQIGDGEAPASAAAGLVWATNGRYDGDPSSMPVDASTWSSPVGRTSIGGTFPAQFTLEILDRAPKPSPYSGLPGQPVDSPAIGFVAALRSDAGEEVKNDDVLGVWLGGGVLYLTGDPAQAQQEAEWARWMSTSTEPGYHLFTYGNSVEAEGEWFRCMNAGVCESPAIGAHPGDFERCKQYSPEAKACEPLSPSSGGAAPEYDAECESLVSQKIQSYGALSTNCGPYPGSVPNPDGFDLPITIELGKTFDQWDRAITRRVGE